MTELNWLNFSDLKVSYESIAVFDKENKQQFVVRVNGFDQALVEQYTKNFRADFQVVSDKLIQTINQTENTNDQDNEQPSFPEDSLEQLSNKDLEVSIQVAKVQDSEWPFISNFKVFQDIRENETLIPDTRPVCKQRNVTVNIKVEKGRIRIKILQRLPSGQWDTNPIFSDVYNVGNFDLTKEVDPRFCYNLRIQGLDPRGSRYSIDGSWRDA